MIQLLIIADDFTGALDTGVQFATRGIETRVVVGKDADFTSLKAEVLVVDTETRHLTAAEAYAAVKDIAARAGEAGVRYLYKKTDSALRGNIGAELTAVLQASGCRQLPFLPAYPQINRITRSGIHYIDGVPVTESPFGADPYEPVRHSCIRELIAAQSDAAVHNLPALKNAEELPEESGILVFDAADEEDLRSTGKILFRGKEDGSGNNRMQAFAGCAGFGAVLPELLGLSAKRIPVFPKLDPRLLVVCGSVNPITLTQLDLAEKAGFTRIRLTPQQKLDPDYWSSSQGRTELADLEKQLEQHERCIIETNDAGGNGPTAEYAGKLGISSEDLRVQIAGSLGQMLSALFTSPALGTLLLTGGDTLLQCMRCVGVKELVPICEMEKGVVLAGFTYKGRTRHVITKSGGFGQDRLLIDLAERLDREAE